MISIRRATEDDYTLIRDFYYELIDAMEDYQYKPGWKKDIYPSREMLTSAIAAGEMYVGFEAGRCAACMIANHAYNEAYEKIKWSVEAKGDEVFVIHALGVGTDYAGRGFAKEMARYVIALAKSHGAKTVRLDVLQGNLPAERAYESVGFRPLETISMYYADTGWTYFKAFEYII